MCLSVNGNYPQYFFIIWCNPALETRAVSLNISKTFDKVWHKGLLFKLESMGISGDLLNLMESFLRERFQRILLNGQSSVWASIKAGIPQGSILFFSWFTLMIFLMVSLQTQNSLLLAHLFSELLMTLMIQQVIWTPISRKYLNGLLNEKYLLIQILPNKLNNMPVQNASSQKHLDMILDEKLNFEYHLKEKCLKSNKGIGVIKKLQNILQRQALLTIYKWFVRPHLDYRDIIYDELKNESFCQKLESYQYNAALAITGAIRDTSQTKIYKELGLESLKFRIYFRRLCTFFKIQQSGLPSYLFNLIPQSNIFTTPNNQINWKVFIVEQVFLKILFFLMLLMNGTSLNQRLEILDHI